MKLRNLFIGLASASTLLATSCIAMTSCGETTTTYKITYNTPTGLTWNITAGNSVVSGNSIYMEYELDDGKTVDATNTTITCDGKSIKSNVTYRYGKVSIPSSYIKGDIVINIVLKDASTYGITYNADPLEKLIWSTATNPTEATAGSSLTATYTVADGYVVDTSTSVVKCGTAEITEHVIFGNGTVYISGEYINGEITFSLTTKEQKDDHTYSDLSGGSIDDGTTKKGLTTYVLTCDESNGGEMSITLNKNWLNSSIKIASAGTYNITLNNCTFTSSATSGTGSIINVTKDAAGAIVNLILPTNSESTFNDLRTYDTATEEDPVVRHNSSDGTGSLNITGAGVLNINNVNTNKGSFTKAIQTKTNMTISNGATINAFSYDTCVQVGGKLTIDNANLAADSYNAGAIRTKALDPEEDLTFSNRNTNRDIVISGKSTVKAYAARNGIASAHNFITQSDSNGSPTIEVYTGKDNAGTKVRQDDALDELNMFIEIPSSTYSKYPVSSYYYTIDFYNNGTLIEDSTEYMTLKKIAEVSGGMGQTSTTQYFYKCDRPLNSNYNQFQISLWKKASYGDTSATAAATSDLITIEQPTSTSYTNDCVAVSSISGTSSGTISTSSTKLDRNYKATVKGETSETSIDTTIGSKGIKANNQITLNAGDILIKSMDTCISASYGDIYCNSSTAGDISYGSGEITLNGAAITTASSEGDGIKAYGVMNAKAGNIDITKAVEGLEAPVLNLSGGNIKIYATDDGLNASSAGIYQDSQLGINMTGGILDVQTSSGDCDAIDSNYTVSITGGLVISRVPSSTSNTIMSLDWEEGNITISNTATIVLLGLTSADEGGMGGSKKTISGGTDYTSSITASTACSEGNHTITYYISSGTQSTYTYNNTTTMYSSKVRVRSCTGKPTIA